MDATINRREALEALTMRWGPPALVRTGTGACYCWRLARADRSAPVHVTLSVPELPEIVHLLIADAAARAVAPIRSVTLRTATELERVAAEIDGQIRTL